MSPVASKPNKQRQFSYIKVSWNIKWPLSSYLEEGPESHAPREPIHCVLLSENVCFKEPICYFWSIIIDGGGGKKSFLIRLPMDVWFDGTTQNLAILNMLHSFLALRITKPFIYILRGITWSEIRHEPFLTTKDMTFSLFSFFLYSNFIFQLDWLNWIPSTKVEHFNKWCKPSLYVAD